MDDPLDTILVSVRADTQAFAADMRRMKASFDGVLGGDLAAAGRGLEAALAGAARKGSLGFEELRRTALAALGDIAGAALGLGLDTLFGRIGGSKPGNPFAGLGLGALFGSGSVPGRAVGGLVAPQAPYLVGERGPELFVPTSAGRIEPAQGRGGARTDVQIAINLTQPRGSDAPVALQRSSRQLAAAVRRALS